MTPIVEVTVTGPRDMMHDLVKALVHDRLIAGGHLVPIDSTYRWEGVVHDAEEIRAAMHTTQARVDTLMKRIRHEHTYEVACIVVVPFTAADPDYIAWVVAQTEPRTEAGQGATGRA